jgi:UDP-N-acetylmuramoyl-L-alanyl-D-glutamate--2,6-diaminopimelate ligase
MLLSEILYEIPLLTVSGKTDVKIKNIIFDSRAVENGSLFVAIPGTQVDGHQYIEKALTLGASAILCETLPEKLAENITYVQVNNSARAMGIAAANFYEHPSKKVKLVGITGTNGKTSVATLLFRLFRQLGHKCGLLSTVQNQIEDEIIPTTHTTPDSVKINELLLRMHKEGCTHVFIEVSSHSVVMERITGLCFTGGIFTNITQDHLDFHETFKNYIDAKKGFFDQLPKTAFALTNTDDRNGKVMLQNTKATKYSYTLRGVGDFKTKIIDVGLFGLQLEIDGTEAWFKLIGKFNAYNLTAVYGTAILLGEEKEEVLLQLSTVQPPDGRFQQLISPDKKVGIIDYAHTPDALENVLSTIQNLREGGEKVITVVGCGGNRDKGKRPIMAKIAVENSDFVFLTSDNPRKENLNDIIAEMWAGVPISKQKKVKILPNRRDAIREAVRMAKSKDIILIAGKGHETYQDIDGVKHHFDDKEELWKAFFLKDT